MRMVLEGGDGESYNYVDTEGRVGWGGGRVSVEQNT